MPLKPRGWLPGYGSRLTASLLAAGVVAAGIAWHMRPYRKELRIGIFDSAPYTTLGPGGKPGGIAYEMAEQAARRAGIRLRWVAAPGPDEALTSGVVDLWPLVAISEQRRQRYYITDRWIETFFCLLSRKENPVLSARRAKGRRIAHANAPRTRSLAAETIPGAVFVETQSRQDAMDAVCQGRADAAFVETRIVQPALMDRSSACSGVALRAVVLEGSAFGSGIGARPEVAREADAIRDEMLNLAHDGTMTRIFSNWNQTGSVELSAVMARLELERRSRWLWWIAGVLAAALVVMALLVGRARRSQRNAARASQAKSQFLANMSHEIRTPLNGVIGFANMLLEAPLGEKEKDMARQIASCSEALLGVINDILDLSRIEAGRLNIEAVPFDLAEIVRGAMSSVEPLAAAKGLRPRLDLGVPAPCWVVGDPLRVRQVLLNLVSNAVKFTQQGSVSVTVERFAGGFTRFCVADTGIGMRAETIEHLFQPFTQADSSTTRQYGGSGLGLAISRRLVEMMGGSIAVESVWGAGSVFRFTMPLPDAARVESGQDLPAESPLWADRAEPVTVMLVEDNAVNQRVVRHLLEKFGYRAVLAANGLQAVEMFETSGCDLILMDCQMPVMDGYQATREIRRIEKARGLARTPILALTAHAMRGDREACLEAGMDDHMSKPVRPEDLRQLLERWHPARRPQSTVAGD